MDAAPLQTLHARAQRKLCPASQDRSDRSCARTLGRRRTSELIRVIREARKPSVGCCLGAAGGARRIAAVCEREPGWKAAAGAACRDTANASAPVNTHDEWYAMLSDLLCLSSLKGQVYMQTNKISLGPVMWTLGKKSFFIFSETKRYKKEVTWEGPKRTSRWDSSHPRIFTR